MTVISSVSNNPTGLGTVENCPIPKALTVPLNFADNPQQLLDLTQLQQIKQIDYVQSIYFETETDEITVAIEETKQVLVLPANSCGYLPIIAPMKNPKILFTDEGTGENLQVIVMNYYVGPFIWAKA